MAEVISIIGIFIGLYFGSLVLRLLFSLFLKPRLLERALRKQGILGSTFSLFNGDMQKKKKMMLQVLASTPKTPTHDISAFFDPLMSQMLKEHGKMFYMWLGTIPRVVVLEPKLIREMLTNKTGEFRKPEINAFTRLFTAGLSSLNGDKWAMHRKIIHPAFHFDKLKGMMPSVAKCTEAMICKWEKALGSKESNEVDVFSEFQKLTADIISHVAFGSSYDEGARVFQLLNEQGKCFSKVYYMAAFPWLRHLPTKINARMKEINNEVTSMLRQIIKRRQTAMEMGGNNVLKDDMLGLLLESNLKEQRENNNSSSQGKGGMTLEEVIEECKLFYFAGHETTANLLTWTIVALSMHPDWQQRAREEVLGLIGKENPPTFDDLSRLKTVTMILQETSRLYPPSTIMRKTSDKGAKLGDKYLPPGIFVFIPTPIVHRDKEVWGKDVLEFDPGRFSDGISKASENDSAPYFPFGWGPRVCIGQNLAMLEAKMALAIMLQRFYFELSPSYAHIPNLSMTLQPLRGAPVIISRVQ